MKQILVAGFAATALMQSQALAQTLTLENFESYVAPLTNTVMFRQPSFSGSTSAKLDASPNAAVVRTVGGFPFGDPNNVLHVSFSFKDSGAEPLWLRLTSNNATTMPNPTIGLWQDWGLKFDVYSDTPLYIAALVRETEANAALGGNGGASGGIEFVGGNPSVATGTRGKEVAANAWTTVYFDFDNESVFSFAGATANGILEAGADGKGVLEALGIATDPANTGTINIWLDNFVLVPEPSSVALMVLGGFTMALFRRARRS